MRARYSICIMFLLLIFVAGCNKDTTSKVEETTETIQENNENEVSFVEENKKFFMDKLKLSEDRALGAAYAVDRAKCGQLIDWENKVEAKHGYSITLINSDGEKYFTSFAEDGFIGPIKDESGNMLDCSYD